MTINARTVSKLSKSTISIGVLIILYLVGLIGVTVPLHEDFMLLTPINLFVTFFVALYAQDLIKSKLVLALVLCYIFGFVIELVGVQTGLLFGDYTYGATLGPKMAGTPLMIGLNWAMLVYAVVSISNHYLGAKSFLIKSIFGASGMVVLDIFIEPAAVRYDFWSWGLAPYNTLIVAPLQNYLVWWVAAFGLNIMFHNLAPNTKNLAIEVLFYLQMLFFVWIFFFV